jgi:predicted short-subunit dehydrogenase-like oxidoreductase (DUF2520 family)
MGSLRIIVAGPGRAGGSILLAAASAGHEIVGAVARRPRSVPAGMPAIAWDHPLPPCDLLVVAVRDDAIEAVAGRLADLEASYDVACHLSGFTPVSALWSLGPRIGSLHPLQTLPDPDRGSEALAGAWAAITAEDPEVEDVLGGFARSLGMRPFLLDDRHKPTYHAASAAASNYVVEALGVAADLFGEAGVPFEAARPLTEAVVRNVFDGGAGAALTGPVARADIPTVAGHLRAARAVSPSLGRQVAALVEATALRAGTHDQIFPVLGGSA